MWLYVDGLDYTHTTTTPETETMKNAQFMPAMYNVMKKIQGQFVLVESFADHDQAWAFIEGTKYFIQYTPNNTPLETESMKIEQVIKIGPLGLNKKKTTQLRVVIETALKNEYPDANITIKSGRYFDIYISNYDACTSRNTIQMIAYRAWADWNKSFE